MRAGLAAVLAMALLATASVPGPATAAPSAAHGDSYTFAFQDADIGQVADEILGRTLGVAYTVDPGVTGKISFRIDQRLTRAQLLEAFEAALAANGIVMVRSGDAVTLTPRAKAKEAAGLQTEGEAGGQAGYAVVAVPLSFATPSEVGKALQTMGQPDIVVYADDKLGLLMLGGTERELDAARQALRVLDRSGLDNSKIRWFDLTQAQAQTVGDELNQILKAANAPGIAIVPLKRLNGILAFARTPQALDEVSSWIAKLDVPGKDEAPALWVYHPLNLSADALASTLNAVLNGVPQTEAPTQAATQATNSLMSGATTPGGMSFGGMSSGGMVSGGSPLSIGASVAPAPAGSPTTAAPASAPQASFGSPGADSIRIGVSRESNILVITAPPSRWAQIKRMLDEIDRAPGQVLIEASVLEVTLTNELRLGVNWSAIAANGKLSIVSSANNAGAVAPTFPGLGITYIGSNIAAAIDALKAVTAVEVISAPKLVALDNHLARLEVGDQVPVTVQSAQETTTANSPLITTTEYRDTGVILNVTPRISGEDHIVLDIDQEVSSVAKTTSSGIDSPTIQQRRLQGTLSLKDGETMALGGMISSNRSRTSTGIPIAKDIPLLGAAFRSNDDSGGRSELIVLITAKIMRDPASSERVMKDLMADMKEIESRGLVGR